MNLNTARSAGGDAESKSLSHNIDGNPSDCRGTQQTRREPQAQVPEFGERPHGTNFNMPFFVGLRYTGTTPLT